MYPNNPEFSIIDIISWYDNEYSKKMAKKENINLEAFMSDTRLVNFNGELIQENEAKVSIYDSALMFGDMVFEMTRSFNKKQFKLEDHVELLLA